MADKSSTLRLYDGEQLTEYLSAGGAPASFGVSNFGAQLQRARILGYAEIRCPVCRRRQFRRKKRRNGHGPNQRVVELFLKAGWDLAQACEVMDWLEDGDCRRCGGTGTVLVRITDGMRANPAIERYPTGSSRHGLPPHTVGDDSDLKRMGRVGNLLVQMRARDPEAAAALTAWKGPGGGSLLVLFGMTAAGRQLLKLKRDPRQHPVTFLESERRRRKEGFPDHTRDRLFERAEAQASLLLETAVMLWNELVRDALAADIKRRQRSAREDARRELDKAGR